MQQIPDAIAPAGARCDRILGVNGARSQRCDRGERICRVGRAATRPYRFAGGEGMLS
jgi:hypothetical protein